MTENNLNVNPLGNIINISGLSRINERQNRKKKQSQQQMQEPETQENAQVDDTSKESTDNEQESGHFIDYCA